MKKIQIILSILIFTSIFTGLNAQKAKLDSLINLLDRHPQKDTIRVNRLNDIAYSLRRNDKEKGLSLAEEALELADKLNFKKGKANCLKNFGSIYKRQSNYPKAFVYY